MFARKATDYLRKWVEESKENIALRLWNGPMISDIVRKNGGGSFTLYNIPLYYAGQINKFLDAHI